MTKFTEIAIKKTFLELLREKPLNQITVKEIVETCGVNRNTFYYHYRDIPALVEEIMTEETEKILAEHPTLGSIEDCMYAILDFVKENQQIVMHIYKSLNRTVFEKYLWKLCRKLVENYRNSAEVERRLEPEEEELLINFFVCACFGMAMNWLMNGMVDSLAREDIGRIFELNRKNAKSVILRDAPKN